MPRRPPHQQSCRIA